jgi:hypothetical protein
MLTALQGVKTCRGCEAKFYLLSMSGEVMRKKQKKSFIPMKLT